MRPPGLMLVSLGSEERDFQSDFFGTSMYWSHYSPKHYDKTLKDMGFKIIFAKFIRTAGEKHYWILARNSKY